MEQAFGKYTLVGRLGGGGMAEVFKALLSGPAGFEKQLALKLILPHFSDDPEFVQMFIHEATLAARLDHANIVRIHEFDSIDERYYIAMELVDGHDLRAVLARTRELDRPLTVGESVLIGVQACRGLAFAHGDLTPGAAQVIHRDISPHNLILSRAGEVKITDFGIAKLASAASLTRTGTIKGKLAYMSPEQARGDVLDKRSDLFSLACVLWELLTGQRLFAGPNEMATLENLKSASIHAPSVHNPEVDSALDLVILKALSREREIRMASAAEFGRSLEQVLSKLSDLDRSTSLASLFLDLFGDGITRKGTALMPAGDQVIEPAVEHAAEEAQSIPSAMGSTDIQPVGPQADTEIAVVGGQAGSEAKPRPGSSIVRRWWMIGLFLLPLVAAFVSMAILSLGDPAVPSEEMPTSADVEDGGASEASPLSDAGLAIAVADNREDAGPEPIGDPANADPVEPVEPVETKLVVDDGDSLGKLGRLQLNVIPWAKVYKGRRFLGDTPLENVRLPAGVHQLILVNKDLGVRRKLQVRIRAGRLTKDLVDLNRP